VGRLPVITGKPDMLNLKDPELLRQQCYIDGAWVDADNGATLDVTNPATGELVARVPKMGAAETRRAIEAAERAWPAWKRKTAKERSAILRRWFELMMAAQDDLAAILTAEQGKPLAEAKGEIAYGASYFEWYAEEAKRVYGDTIPTHQGDKRVVVLKDPIGVCAAVTPWNFPNAMITRKAGPALAAGCPIVVKPASQTPLSALAIAVLVSTPGMLRALLTTMSLTSGVTTTDLPSALTAVRKFLKLLVLISSIAILSTTTISPSCALEDRTDLRARRLTFLLST
jgi:succinate-semialdehyde dehydrogenase/glutarate-semialdehyde dehydrogenase